MSYSKMYASMYCDGDITLIENYQEARDSEERYELHHRYETHDENGKLLENTKSIEDLKSSGMYYKRPPEELIFLTEKDHKALHMMGNDYAVGKHIGNKYALGNVLSKETRKKMSDSRKGNRNNGVAFIRCKETGEIRRTREWVLLGFNNVYKVASGKNKTCKGLMFEYVTTF